MVSNARLDLPDPESPVTTIRRSRGISTEMFFRLCTRAPWTAMVVRAAARLLAFAPSTALFRAAVRVVIARIPSAEREEGELLDLDVTASGQLNRQRGLADESLVGKVFTGGDDPLEVQVASEVGLDLLRRPRLAGVAQVVEHGREDRRRAFADVAIDRVERGLDALRRLAGIEQVAVHDREERRVQLHRLRNHLAIDEQAVADHLDLGERRGRVEDP